MAILLGLITPGLFLQRADSQVLHRRENSVLAHSTQLVVIITPEWNAQTGTLRRYERSQPGAAWRMAGHPIGVVVGKNGLGWETGSMAANPGAARSPSDPVKKQGDLRSPAGIFKLGAAFGYAGQQPPTWRMPYLRVTESTECVDDPHSVFYNQIVDRSTVSPDWKSSVHMLHTGDLDQWGLVVEQNLDPVQRGDGSCVFLNAWAGPGEPTIGCTATAEGQVKILLHWLDPQRQPRLVQLPAAKYAALEKAWNLPAIPPPGI